MDGFRFDLTPMMARGPDFDPRAAIFAALAADPLLYDRVLGAEPGDIGHGGYQHPMTMETWEDPDTQGFSRPDASQDHGFTVDRARRGVKLSWIGRNIRSP